MARSHTNLWTSRRQGVQSLKQLVNYIHHCTSIYVFKSYPVIYGNFSTEEAGFDWQLREQKLFFVRKTGTALQEMRGGFGPHAHSFPGLSRDLIITVINSNAFMTLCHLWKEPAVLFAWSQAPPRKPRACGRSWSPGTKPWGGSAAKQPKAACWRQSMGKNNM